MNLDRDIMASDATSLKKEWKSFYYPNPYQHSSHGLSNGIPFAWSNGVINNNNLLNVGGGYPPVGATGVPGDLGMGYKPLLGTTNTLQCLLFGVVGLVTFLLNSVMALVLSVKLPGLEGLLGGLLGGVGLGGLGALTKQEVVDTKGKHMEYIHFPDRNHGHGGGGSGNGGSVDNTLQSVDNSEYFDKNR